MEMKDWAIGETQMALSNSMVEDEDDLTDEQVKRLLKNAEERLKQSPPLSKTALTTRNMLGGSFVGLPKLDTGKIVQPYVTSHAGIAQADPSRLLSDRERQLSGRPRKVDDPVMSKRKVTESNKATAGADWFNLPRTNLTLESKRDLQLIRMRSVLDPKRHYKKENGKAKAPEFSQFGTIVEGPADFYSSRLLTKERKKTFVDEILAGEQSSSRFRSKYSDIQSTKTSGKKAYYKALMERRTRGIRK